DLLPSRIVQRIIQARDHPDGVAEGGMGGHILDPLPVNPDLTAVTQALDILGPSERPRARRSRGATMFGGSLHDHALLKTLIRPSICNREPGETSCRNTTSMNRILTMRSEIGGGDVSYLLRTRVMPGVECGELLHASPELRDFLVECRRAQVRHVQAHHDLRCLAEPPT